MVGLGFDRLFSSLRQEEIIFFEDDFRVNFEKSSIVYSVLRQNKTSRIEMVEEIRKVSPSTACKLSTLIESIDLLAIPEKEWIGCLEEFNFESAFITLEDKAEKLKTIYNDTNFDDIPEEVIDIMQFYGIGVDYPALFDTIFKEYIFKDFEWKRFKVLRSYSASDEKRLQDHIENRENREDGIWVCIIDNQLGRQSRAKEIIDSLKKFTDSYSCTFIGCILSSTTEEESINRDVYFENVKKSDFLKIQSAIAKSAYSYILKKLSITYKKVMDEAFKAAIESKNIAFYLSNMASTEGITNYQVITEWIKLLFDYKLHNNNDIFELVRITKLIDLLDDKSISFSDEMSKLNTFEAFNFNVNKFFEPIASGDIFAIGEDKKMFLLVGQDCDMMNVPGRLVRNGVSELICADIGNQTEVGNEVHHDREDIRIANFRRDINEPAKSMVIKYKQRNFIDNQLLQLCQFSKDGECCISLTDGILDNMGVMPDYYPEIYNEAQNYYRAIKLLKENNDDSLETILRNKNSPRIICLSEYKVSDGKIVYPIKRICRLKNPYMLFIYKMYLDYRGRHPFNTINMSMNQDVEMDIVGYPGKKMYIKVFLSINRSINLKDRRHLVWGIDPIELNRLLDSIFNDENYRVDEHNYILLEKTDSPYTDFVELANGKYLRFTKRKKEIDIGITQNKG